MNNQAFKKANETLKGPIYEMMEEFKNAKDNETRMAIKEKFYNRYMDVGLTINENKSQWRLHVNNIVKYNYKKQ